MLFRTRHRRLLLTGLVIAILFALTDTAAEAQNRPHGRSNSNVRLSAPSDSTDGSFGTTVALKGDTFFVGAPTTESGRVYPIRVTRRDAGTLFTRAAPLGAGLTSAGAFFGAALSFDGTRLLVGAPYDDINGDSSGTVFVFDHDAEADAWTTSAQLTASDGQPFDEFGAMLSLDGDRAVIGSSRATHVVEFDTTTQEWVEVARLDSVGRSVALDGDRLVIGERLTTHIFELDSATGNWVLSTSLDQGTYSSAGVDIDGDRIAVNGTIYEFDAASASWALAATLPVKRNPRLDGDRVLSGTTVYDRHPDTAEWAGREISAPSHFFTLNPLDSTQESFAISSDLDGDLLIFGSPSNGSSISRRFDGSVYVRFRADLCGVSTFSWTVGIFGDTFGDDVIVGTDGDDDIRVTRGADLICPGRGDDRIRSWTPWDDTITYADLDGPIRAKAPPHTYGPDGSFTLIGTPFDDTLIGNAGDNLIDGGGGNDTILARGGDDTVIGGDGDDRLQGGTGDDTIEGGPGDDLLFGNAGDDLLTGGPGADALYGWADTDTCEGKAGLDTYFGCETALP